MSVVAFSGSNPCTACGACCASYRVSFYWAEADVASGGMVPVEMSERITSHLMAMKGTSVSKPRCVALKGNVGEHVFCDIYSQRPTVCREFSVAWENGVANDRCNKARALWDIPPLLPEHPIEPDQPTTPKAA